MKLTEKIPHNAGSKESEQRQAAATVAAAQRLVSLRAAVGEQVSLPSMSGEEQRRCAATYGGKEETGVLVAAAGTRNFN